MKNEIISAMMMEISGGCSLHKLCDMISEGVNNPVAFSLKSESIIGHSKSFTKDLVEEFTSATRYMTDDEISDMRADFDQLLLSGKPHIQAWPYIRHKQINCGCLYNGCMLGNLIVDVANGSADDIDVALIEACSSCVAVWLAAHGYVTSRSGESIQNFIKGLLLNEVTFEMQRKNLAYFPLNDSVSYRVVWICFENGIPEKSEIQFAKLCKNAKKWWHVSHENGIVILMDDSSTDRIDLLRPLLESFRAYACVSDRYTNIYDTQLHFHTTSSIMEIIHRWPEIDRITFANDCKILLAFNYARVHMDTAVFDNELLNWIVSYDQQHDSFYLDTLRSYFYCGYDYDKMAQRLYVKKNSVFYRMNKLCSMFNIHLNDPLQMAGLYCSLLAYDNLL